MLNNKFERGLIYIHVESGDKNGFIYSFYVT